MTSTALAGRVALVATGIAFLSLTILHVLSPEFQPSWRMVSEYANGRHGWLLSMMFAAWGLGTLALAWALGPSTSGALGRAGVAFLVLAGIGEMMAAVFDINHRLHGLAAMIGIPSLPIAALLITRARRRADRAEAPPAWAAHLTWISDADRTARRPAGRGDVVRRLGEPAPRACVPGVGRAGRTADRSRAHGDAEGDGDTKRSFGHQKRLKRNPRYAGTSTARPVIGCQLDRITASSARAWSRPSISDRRLASRARRPPRASPHRQRAGWRPGRRPRRPGLPIPHRSTGGAGS
jgi:hypothetical membrane protein